MRNLAEEKAIDFYNGVGWEAQDGRTEDAARWEDLRASARSYVSRCRLRVLRHIPERGDLILEVGSGPIQYPEYLEYSKNFNKRYCVDLSQKALLEAARKIGQHGVFLNKSFFDVDFAHDTFDCTVSLHAVYHMDASLQEEAVRKMIRFTKPTKPVIIVYSNPQTPYDRLMARPVGLARRAARKVLRRGPAPPPDLYFFSHPLGWWERFRDVADVRVLPWRSFTADGQKRFFPNNRAGELLFDWLFRLEDAFPHFFARHSRYPMIVLTKR